MANTPQPTTPQQHLDIPKMLSDDKFWALPSDQQDYLLSKGDASYKALNGQQREQRRKELREKQLNPPPPPAGPGVMQQLGNLGKEAIAGVKSIGAVPGAGPATPRPPVAAPPMTVPLDKVKPVAAAKPPAASPTPPGAPPPELPNPLLARARGAFPPSYLSPPPAPSTPQIGAYSPGFMENLLYGSGQDLTALGHARLGQTPPLSSPLLNLGSFADEMRKLKKEHPKAVEAVPLMLPPVYAVFAELALREPDLARGLSRIASSYTSVPGIESMVATEALGAMSGLLRLSPKALPLIQRSISAAISIDQLNDARKLIPQIDRLMKKGDTAGAKEVLGEFIGQALGGVAAGVYAGWGGPKPPAGPPGERVIDVKATHEAEGAKPPGATEARPEEKPATAALPPAEAPQAEPPREAVPPKSEPPAPLVVAVAPDPGVPPGLTSATVVDIPSDDIHWDPKRFQFRTAISQTMRKAMEEGRVEYEPEFAGVTHVWKDPVDGLTYGINGHHRGAMREASGYKGPVPSRYINAATAEEARTIGAIINIAEGHADPIDIGKMIREQGESGIDTIQRKYGMKIPPSMLRQGQNLARLDDSIFEDVAIGKVPQAWGDALGQIDDPAIQHDALKLMDREVEKGRSLTPAQAQAIAQRTERMAGRIAQRGGSTKKKTLFGELEESNVAEAARMESYLKQRLAQDRRIFSYVSNDARAKELEKAGNILAQSENRDRAANAKVVEDTFNKLVGYAGPVEDAIAAGAARLAKGEKIEQVGVEVYRAVADAVGRELGGNIAPEPVVPPSMVAPEPPAKPKPSKKKAAPPSPIQKTVDVLTEGRGAAPPVVLRDFTPEEQAEFTQAQGAANDLKLSREDRQAARDKLMDLAAARKVDSHGENISHFAARPPAERGSMADEWENNMHPIQTAAGPFYVWNQRGGAIPSDPHWNAYMETLAEAMHSVVRDAELPVTRVGVFLPAEDPEADAVFGVAVHPRGVVGEDFSPAGIFVNPFGALEYMANTGMTNFKFTGAGGREQTVDLATAENMAAFIWETMIHEAAHANVKGEDIEHRNEMARLYEQTADAMRRHVPKLASVIAGGEYGQYTPWSSRIEDLFRGYYAPQRTPPSTGPPAGAEDALSAGPSAGPPIEAAGGSSPGIPGLGGAGDAGRELALFRGRGAAPPGPLLPGFGPHVEEQARAAGARQGELLTEAAAHPPVRDVSGISGNIERTSPLFRGKGASGQAEMFGPDLTKITPEPLPLGFTEPLTEVESPSASIPPMYQASLDAINAAEPLSPAIRDAIAQSKAEGYRAGMSEDQVIDDILRNTRAHRLDIAAAFPKYRERSRTLAEVHSYIQAHQQYREMNQAKPEGARPPTAEDDEMEYFAARRIGGPQGPEGVSDLLRDLRDKIEQGPDVPPASITAAVRQAQKLAGQNPLRRAAASLYAIISQVGKSIANNFRPPTLTAFNDIAGDFDYAMQLNESESGKFADTIKRRIKDPLVLEAMNIWREAGGDTALIKQQGDEMERRGITKYLAVWRAAENLSQEAKDTAMSVGAFYGDENGGTWKLLHDEKAVNGFIDDYVNRFWKKPGKTAATLAAQAQTSSFNQSFRFALKRVWDSTSEGILHGEEPATLNVADLIRVYARAANTAINSRRFVKALLAMTASDGRPVVVPTGAGKKVITAYGDTTGYYVMPDVTPGDHGYLPVDNHNFWHWDYLMKDDNGAPILMRGQLKVHPEYLKVVNAMLGQGWASKWSKESAGTARRTVAAIRRAQGVVKETKFSLSAFHLNQLSRRTIMMWVYPFSVEEPDLRRPILKEGITDGALTLYSPKSLLDFGEGQSGTGLLKHIPGIGKKMEQYNHWMFDRWLPALKAKVYEHLIERNLKRYSGKYTRKQIVWDTAQSVNDLLGGRSWKRLGTDPSTLDTLRAMFMTPDFTFGSWDFASHAFRPMGAEHRWSMVRTLLMWVLPIKALQAALCKGSLRWDDPFSIHCGSKEPGESGAVELRSRDIWGDTWQAAHNPRMYAMNRAAPWVGQGTQLALGRDKYGMPYGPWHFLWDMGEMIAPMPLQGMWREPRIRNLVYSAIGASGIGVYDYKSAATAQALELLQASGSRRLVSGEEAKERDYVRQFLRLNSMTDRAAALSKVDELQGEGKISAADARGLRRSLPKAPLVSMFGSLYLDGKLQVWNKATAEERIQLHPYLGFRKGESSRLIPKEYDRVCHGLREAMVNFGDSKDSLPDCSQ